MRDTEINVTIESPVVPTRTLGRGHHCTLYYIGSVPMKKFISIKPELIVADTLWQARVRHIGIKGPAWYGPNLDVPVLELYSPYLKDINEHLATEFTSEGFESSSDYASPMFYNPHVTVSGFPKKLPVSVGLLPPIIKYWNVK